MQTFYTFMSDFTSKNYNNMSEFAKKYLQKNVGFLITLYQLRGALRGLTPARRGGG